MASFELIGLLAGTALALAGGYYSYGHYRLFDVVSGTPTSDVRAIDEEGVVELSGRVTNGDTLDVTLSESSNAVVSGWRIDDWNESGDSSSWRTVALGVDSGAFELDDGTGSVRVDPPRASSGAITTDDKLLSMGGDGLYVDGCRAEFERLPELFRLEPDDYVSDDVEAFVQRQPDVDEQSGSLTNFLDFGRKHGERRFFEATIDEGEEVYLLGHARAREDATYPLGPDDVVIGPDPAGDDPFVLSTVGEESLLSGTKRRLAVAALVAAVGLALIAGSLAV